jgi:hypothetical protein
LGHTSSAPLSSHHSSSPPSSDSSIYMWKYQTAVTNKNAQVWLELEDDESMEIEKGAQEMQKSVKMEKNAPHEQGEPKCPASRQYLSVDHYF